MKPDFIITFESCGYRKHMLGKGFINLQVICMSFNLLCSLDGNGVMLSTDKAIHRFGRALRKMTSLRELR